MIDLEEFNSENIAERMKARLNNPASKLEGSFAMDCIQSISQELSRLSIMSFIDICDQYLIDTAEGEYLDKKAKDYFMERNPATSAVGTVIFSGQSGTLIPEKTSVIADGIVFLTDHDAVIPDIGITEVKVVCETSGTVGNIAAGMITGVSSSSSVSGVEVRNDIAFVGGTEEESDEHFRDRIYEKKQNPIVYGNNVSYEIWAKEISGVGNAKCLPCQNGNGTATLVILSDQGGIPDDMVMRNVTDYIETKRLIGAKISVIKAVPKQVSISCTIKLKDGYTTNSVLELFTELMNEYLIKKAFGEKKELSYHKIANILFSISSVDDVIDYTINNGHMSVSAEPEEFFSVAEVIINDQ